MEEDEEGEEEFFRINIIVIFPCDRRGKKFVEERSLWFLIGDRPRHKLCSVYF
jgi:hypothetical protein